MREKGDTMMKKNYVAPDMEKISVLTADVITFSQDGISVLGEDDWSGKSINDLEFN